MKTKHIQYRSALLIGLLSLNTLSSCVNTSRGLGMDGGSSTGSTKRNNNVEEGRNTSSKNSSPFMNSAKDMGKEALKGLGAAVAGGTIGYFLGSSSKNCASSNSSSYNASSTGAGSNSTGEGWGVSKPSWR